MNKTFALLLTLLLMTPSIYADSDDSVCTPDCSRTEVVYRPCFVMQLFSNFPLKPFLCSRQNLGVTASGTWAVLCDECGQGDKQFRCINCGQPGARIQAMLCSQCASQNSSCCIKCGKNGAHIPARLCDQCGFGEQKNECVKCGRIHR